MLTADITWSPDGPLEVDQNTASFPGTTAHFTGRRRDSIATGSVTLDGKELVNGASTGNADLETLEDRRITKPQQQEG